MKASIKFIFVFFSCLLCQSLVQAQSITTGTITGSPFCPGAAVAVPFTLSGVSIGPGNVFTAQLSDASGSFASPVNIGTGTPPSINATIPLGTPAGTGYRIRVTSSNQPVTGSPNTTNLTIGSSTIGVTGNAVSIADGSTTPSLANFTDFGSTTVGSNIVRTFTITNAGTSSLPVSSITLSGANASMFTVGSLTPASPIAAGGSATFSVTFLPTATGTKIATITISNSSCNVAAYDFAIQGSATAPTINTLAFQGFENGQCDSWSFTGGNTNSELARTGASSARVGRSGESNTLTFNSFNTTGFGGLVLSMYHAVKDGASTGYGMDTREGAVILVSLNGGGFTAIGRVGGFGDLGWAFGQLGGSSTGSSGCNIYQCPNPLVYNIPNGTSSVQVRVVSVKTTGTCATFNTLMTNATASNYDLTNEGFYIDDIKITTTSPLPIVLTSAAHTDAQSTCINTPITNITYSIAGGGGATVTGLPTGLTGTYNNGIFTISGTPTTTVGSPFSYTVTSSCTGETATGVITVKPTPTITLTSAASTNAQTVCTNTAIANITYSIGGSGTGVSVTGLPAGVTGAYNAGVFTISGTPTATGTFNYTVTTTGTCLPQATATGSIIVKPDATIALTSAASTNAQSLCINTALTNITYSIVGGGTGAGITGLPAGLVGTYSAGVFTISGTPTAAGSFNYTVTTTGTCVQATATGSIIVNPDAAIILTSAASTDAQTLCINNTITNITYTIGGSGTGATITGLPAGVTGVYSAGVFTISGTPTATGTFNYTVTTTGTCAQTTATGSIIVNPDAGITLTSAASTSSQSICVNTAIANITYAISGGGTGASISGLPRGVTGTYSAGVFTISGTPTVTGTFNYTITTTGSCAQVTATGSISITPDATINLISAAGTASQAICINTAITSITYAISGGGTNANITGLPAGVTGVFNTGVFTISGTPTATGTFNYIVTTTGSCGQTTATGSITVNPDATITLNSAVSTNAQAVCINTAITNITYTIGGGGTDANVTGLPVGITGIYSAGVFTISGTPTATGTFNYTVTTSGTCAQSTATGTITVNPDASIILNSTASTASQAVCINTAITNITYAISGGGTGASATGLPAGVTGIYNAGVFTISGIPTATGTFSYTVTTTGTCTQNSATGTITINPNATITLSSATNTDVQTLCVNTAITNISYAIIGGGTGEIATGLPAGVTGIYNAGVFTISGIPTATGTFNYTVTTSGTCTQATATGTITVSPDATITLNSAASTTSQAVCINTAITNITYMIGGGGINANATGLPAGVTGVYNGGVLTISGTPNVTGNFNYTITTTGTCAQKTETGTIKVNPDATITLTSTTATLVQTVCINTAITDITYSIAGGGTGANITGLPAGVTAVYNGGVLTISGTPTVSGTFNYAINTTGTCIQVVAAGIITVTPNVTPAISISASPSGIFCAGTPITFTATITNGGSAPSYQWKKNGTNAGTNAPTYTDNALTTTDAITCILTSNAPCVSPASVTSNPVSVTVGGPISQVSGNSISIADGDMTPNTTDNTDFGNGNTNSTVTNTFTINNTGIANLTISSITVSGADASLFTVGALIPASPIAPGGSATFTVSFLPTSAGIKTATININNNSCSSSLQDFAIQGNGIAMPASALDFDGVNDYVSIPHNALLKPTSQITIEAWVNPRDIHTNTYYEIYRKEDGNGRHLFSFQEHGTILSFGLGVGTTYVELDVPINKADYENQWVHVAATYDGKTKRVYRNGVLIGSINTTGPIISTGTSPVLIGQNQAQPEYFNGKIDEVRLWGRALCQTEIQQTMNCELTIPQNGLIAYYKFNQGFASIPNPSVITLLDASGNNLNGTLINFSLASSTSNWVTPGGVVTGVSCLPAQFALLTPAVVISSSPINPICLGTNVTFTATPSNGGTAPTYIWKKNTITISGATSATYSTNTLANNDEITCVMTSSEPCVTTPTATSNTLQMVVNAPTTPIFTPVTPVCQNTTAPTLPTTSTNGITGTWSPTVSTATVGTATYTFTPAIGECGTSTTLQITVNAPTAPTFAPIAAVCQNATAPVLPTTSTNGITGTWSPAVSTASVGIATYTFTPTTGQCATTATLQITINPPTAPTFVPVAAVCQNATAPVLPTTSTNSITGTWSPAVSTASAGTATYTFTPATGQCATTTTMQITVNAPMVPTFAPVAAVCQNATAPILPTTSTNGITGTWSPAVSTVIVGTSTYTFTPAIGQCATTANLQVTVIAPTIPTFAPIAAVCQNAAAPTLPTTSSNGITGTWSPTISTATAGTTVYTFTPATGQCATTATLQITVTAPTIPTFAPVAAVCQNATAPVLPTTSTNGITGTWSPTISTATAGTTVYTFTPALGQCATTTITSITVNPSPTLIVSPLTAAICLGNSITLQATSNAIVQWQGFATGMSNISVTPVATDSYKAIATSALGCTSTMSSTINVQASFKLTLTATTNPATKGRNVTFTTSSSLPFQITAWQPSSLFANQTANSQTIIANTSGDYYAVGKTAAGCIDTAHVNLQVITINNDLFIPNFFTPNNDGKNDVLKVYGTSIKSVEMRVFNQWGELIFETKDVNKGWDGTQSSKQQPVGVYIYVVKATLINGDVIDKKGSINLIR